MTIKGRSLVIGSLFVLVSVLYGAARHYSSSLIFYVVEQSLIQKAPPGADTALLQKRFQAQISAIPDKDSQMKKLLRISEYLEKVQHLTLAQLEELLGAENPKTSHYLPLSFRYGGKTGANRTFQAFAYKVELFRLKDV
jgi:hypothetical protein